MMRPIRKTHVGLNAETEHRNAQRMITRGVTKCYQEDNSKKQHPTEPAGVFINSFIVEILLRTSNSFLHECV